MVQVDYSCAWATFNIKDVSPSNIISNKHEDILKQLIEIQSEMEKQCPSEERILSLGFYETDLEQFSWQVDVRKLDDIMRTAFPPFRERKLPDVTVFLKVSEDAEGANLPLSPKFDIADYVLSLCGSTVEEF